jgi:twitching motility protein PilJ
MSSGTNYSQEYGQAEKAYLESNFALAAEIIDRLAEEFPDDPNVLLLRGHIYCYGFHDYNLAEQQYQSVLNLCDRQDLLDFARSGIEQLEQLKQQPESELKFDEDNLELPEIFNDRDLDGTEDSVEYHFTETRIATSNSSDEDFDFESDYQTELNSAISESNIEHDASNESGDNPFVENARADLEKLSSFDGNNDIGALEGLTAVAQQQETQINTAFGNNFEDNKLAGATEDFAVNPGEYENNYDNIDITPAIGGNIADKDSELQVDTILTEDFAVEDSENYDVENVSEPELNYHDELEFDEIDSSFFDLEDLEQGLPDTGLFKSIEGQSGFELSISGDLSDESDSSTPEDVAISGASGMANTIFTTAIEPEPTVEVKQGMFADFINASIGKKQFVTAGVAGLITAIAVLVAGIIGSNVAARQDSDRDLGWGIRNNLLLALIAGASSAGTAAALGNITAKHVIKASQDLQNQFNDVYQGNLNAKATVYSQDEFGQLASGFNRMTKVILTTTQEAQRRAEETEQAKEDLQRQVIRLLDDVEGAARGDLTVQATVTADVLGAVADAFNLTIQSLREIVRQVKEAAEKVNKGSTDSESYARNQSNEALRMAEELAVTLNSVQMMTESIERVADNAREAEEVARSSSVTALKGGKAVERTVSGIFQIRETVSETARKVKRLAEASQEISKIVLLISQIAERTNQLALNASIQAAKAGEAGRGFAVVADEVRQLADRSGKSLKEIEQIVLQIQSETGSVMTAMEEGIQEVIDVTERAEQAKTALEDIIQVSNRIDTLVRSITADTVEQRENSRAVAQVMQSVELTAQATSQESQRVGGALQSLVGIARGLLASVERFRIDKE